MDNVGSGYFVGAYQKQLVITSLIHVMSGYLFGVFSIKYFWLKFLAQFFCRTYYCICVLALAPTATRVFSKNGFSTTFAYSTWFERIDVAPGCLAIFIYFSCFTTGKFNRGSCCYICSGANLFARDNFVAGQFG